MMKMIKKKKYNQCFYGESKNSWNLKQVKEYPTDYMTGCRFSFHIPKVEQSISLPCIAIRPTFFYIICNNYASHKIFVKLLLCLWTTGHHQNVISISFFQWTLKDGSIQSDLVFIIVQLQEEVGPDDRQWSLTENTYEIMWLGCCIEPFRNQEERALFCLHTLHARRWIPLRCCLVLLINIWNIFEPVILWISSSLKTLQTNCHFCNYSGAIFQN